MQFYKLAEIGGRTEFVPLQAVSMHQQGLPEKKMEQWLADNAARILPEDEEKVLVLCQEIQGERMADILAVDRSGNLVIIELKRGQSPRDVIAQAIEYAADVAAWDYKTLNDRAVRYFQGRGLEYGSLLEAFNDVFALSPGEFLETSFNQDQRIVIVSEGIDERVANSARWLVGRGLPISCVSYACYRAGDTSADTFLGVEEVLRPDVYPASAPGRKPPIRRSDDEMITALPDRLRALYLTLRGLARAFGQDVNTHATRDNLVFKAAKNFAEIHPRPGLTPPGFIIYVRPEGFSIEEKQSAEVHGLEITRVADNHGWSVNHRFFVDEQTDLGAVQKLLRQSYNAASGKT